ncbi:MAG: hypothetical protein NPIRA01_04570 [Nitrospirales bacterium]|nr:MAG: hypothetical protein NPIRA01_04570 [Nitrospirales bacterium]
MILQTMNHQSLKLQPKTRQAIASIFQHLDYPALGAIYCDEGGEAFWKAHRRPCERMGNKLAEHLKARLAPNGTSLYVGAGVAEISPLMMETSELKRSVAAYNLLQDEVEILNHTCQNHGLWFTPADAQEAKDTYDHIWIVSVLNDPERFPELSALSYGRANPATFETGQFQQERETVFAMTNSLLNKLARPGLITTSVEEIPWITHYCEEQALSYTVGDDDFPTAIVKDPICFIQIQ